MNEKKNQVDIKITVNLISKYKSNFSVHGVIILKIYINFYISLIYISYSYRQILAHLCFRVLVFF